MTLTGINIFGPEMQGEYARRAVVAHDDRIVGVLYKSNEMPSSPWWAGQQLMEWLGEPFTSSTSDYSEAAREFLARAEEIRNEHDAE